MTPDEFETFLKTAPAERVREFFRGKSEPERRLLAPVALRLFDEMDKVPLYPHPGEAFKAVFNAVKTAALETAVSSELLQRRMLFHWNGPEFEIIADRRPYWLDAWAQADLERNRTLNWQLIRRLVLAGLCRKPACEQWTLGFIGGGVNLRRYSNKPLRDVLLSEPDILSDEIWKLFEVEGTTETSLSQHDKYSGPPYEWCGALVELANEGRISREHLLDASMDALQRDFAQFRAGWFSTFHEALKPTIEERAARVDRYLGLLGSRIPPTVSFALHALVQLDKAGRLPPVRLLDRVSPALLARAKSAVLSALSLMKKAADKDPSLRARAALLAVDALAHEHPEVQARALELLARWGDHSDSGLRERVTGKRDLISASVRKQLDEWLGEREKSALAPDAQVPPRSHNAQERLPLRAASSLEEAIEFLSGAIERMETAEEIEAALDGVSRFCGAPPADFGLKTGPLRKRAGKLLQQNPRDLFTGMNLQGDLCALAVSWIDGTAPPPPAGKPWIGGFLSRRIHEVALRAASRRPGPLFACPSTSGGWLEPSELIERARTGVPDPLDAIQSLLRLIPDDRDSALKKAAEAKGEFGAALRYALGGNFEGRPGTGGLWLAAARARAPQADDSHISVDGPDGTRAARYSLRSETASWGTIYLMAAVEPPLPSTASQDHVTVLFHYHAISDYRTHVTRALVRWTATIWPQMRESYFARGFKALSDNRDWSEAAWGNRHYLEPLLGSDVPMTPMARLLLAMGLAVKEAGEGGLAADVTIQAVQEGRLDGPSLGDAMSQLLATGAINTTRWAARLGEVARVSEMHTLAARDAVEGALKGLPTETPRDLPALLTLLYELCVQTRRGVQSDTARRALASIKVGGMTGKRAGQILSLP